MELNERINKPQTSPLTLKRDEVGRCLQQRRFVLGGISAVPRLPVTSADPRQQTVFARLQPNREGLVQFKGHAGQS